MKNEVVVGKSSDALDRSKNKLGKQAKKRVEEQERQKDDAVVEISTKDVMTMHHPPSASGSQKKNLKGKGKVEETRVAFDDSDANSEVEEQEKALGQKGKMKARKAFEQRDLVARAFAGDNVVQVRVLDSF